ncbi:unnamed protein product [Mytilus coruscus]|uniref:Uncharacterized protein n=1 Tax=Mytilus coruscus TaxID=42192 RepID=A0A6J8E514_MYTCO|nr:unnamed protein product [Mytilus coruscus]
MATKTTRNVSGKGSVRPLGSIKHNTGNDRIPKLPSFTKTVEKSKMENVGIHGNAMNVPPPKVREDIKPKTLSAKSDSSSSTKSVENMVDKKELQEAKAREKDLLKKIAELQKIIEELKEQITEKDQTISSLENKLKEQEQTYKDKLDEEKQLHSNTKNSLESLRKELEASKEENKRIAKRNEELLNKFKNEMDEKLKDITELKDKELALRDEKLNRLKKQMADALKGNSWERQQQLEELTKELARLQEECDTLRMKLKSFKSKGSCSNCSQLSLKNEELQKDNKEKEKLIKDLKGLLTKFQTQLKQQEQLMLLVEDSKGLKSTKLK